MPAVADTPRLKALKSAPLNRWVVLSSDESTVLAVGNSFEEASHRADELGPAAKDAVVIKTPPNWSSFSV